MKKGFWWRYLHKRTHSHVMQWKRYTSVSALSLLIDTSLLYLFSEVMDYNYFWSAAVSFIIALAINTYLCVVWVFNAKKVKSRTGEVLLFVIVGISGLVLNQFVIWLATGVYGLYIIYSKLLAALASYIWNFYARRKALYMEDALLELIHFDEDDD